jgi:uncharacterized protein
MPDTKLPDYEQIVRFLFQPFLSDAAAIGVDCEYTIDRRRVWIRVAVASDDRGSAFGRGGRNIQAVRTVLQAAAAVVGQSIHLDVYGSSSYRDADEDRDAPRSGDEHRSSDRRPQRSAPTRRSPDRQDRGDTPAVPPPRPRRSAS